MTTKISMIGPPEVGKTTIKKVIFEGQDPNELIMFPLEATIGIKFSIHNFNDIQISLLDSPGQSLPLLLEDEQKQILTFGDTSAIIYVFDYPTWIKNSQDILDDVKKVYEIRKKHGYEAKLILFLHKIDLLMNKKIGSMLALIRRQITNQLNLPEELPIYFTSLHPNLIYTTYNAISDTISNFSEDTSILKEFIRKAIKGLSKTSCFVSNQDDNLLIQEMSNDFDTSMLFYLYEKIYHLSKSSEFTSTKTSIISPGAKILNMVIEDINKYHSNFKYVILLSETIEQEDMIKILDDLKKEMSQYYQ
ncbi:MAG: GTPase [Candidatus Odinarchaeota archaeon]